MKFSFIDKQIDNDLVNLAKRSFKRLAIELAVRKDNYHVGTGLGGNNFQLLTLMTMKHSLINSDAKLIVKGDEILWGVDFILESSTFIRRGLDKYFSLLPEKNKYIAAALNDENDHKSIRSRILSNHEQFPNLVRAMTGRNYTFDRSMSYIEQYLFMSVMAQELATYLDEGDTSTVRAMGYAFEQYPQEIVLMTLRKYVGIHRLIKHNLDEDPVMSKVLYAINRSIDG